MTKKEVCKVYLKSSSMAKQCDLCLSGEIDAHTIWMMKMKRLAFRWFRNKFEVKKNKQTKKRNKISVPNNEKKNQTDENKNNF